LGNINFHDGLNSFVFEIDPLFSTYYDYKVAWIIANGLLYTYILQKINDDEIAGSLFAKDFSSDGYSLDGYQKCIDRTDLRSLCECSLSYGKIGIRKVSLVLEKLFQNSLGDLHNAFHRMKYRAGSRTSFLDQL